MGGGDSQGGGFRIPAAVAVTLWFASAMAVAGYTVIAFAETASGSDTLNASPPGGAPLKRVASSGVTPKDIGVTGAKKKGTEYLDMIPPFNKPTNRQKFTPSRDVRRGKYGKQK
jgi:hypothetical protein